VISGSPADQAGLQPHDIITKIGATTIDENHSYLNSLFQYQPGEAIRVTFVRDGREMQVEVSLGESTGG
jgi:S1-C subfamily serine protease